MKTRSKADSYLAAATCAYNQGDDMVAEEYALKSAKDKEKWIKIGLKIPQIKEKIRTGGLAETYMLAHVTSGSTRWKAQSIKYAEHSGQCKDAQDRLACAEGYYNSTIKRYSNRNIQASRTSMNTDTLALKGKVSYMLDEKEYPMKYVRMVVECGSNKLVTQTDENGYYKFPISTDMSICSNGYLYIIFQYRRDDKNYWTIKYKNEPMIVRKKFSLIKEQDLTQNFLLKNGTEMDNNVFTARPAAIKHIHHFYYSYHHMTEVFEFWKYYMNAKVEYKLPIDVHLFAKPTGASAKSTFYHPYSHPTRAQIVINRLHSYADHKYRPMNREWHEFNHHVMFANYGKWPWVSKEGHPPQKNHAGYINPSTSDSYLEGFAEFYAMVLADHLNKSSPWIYSSFGSFDDNWKAWSRQGKYEEIAVAGILWDLYDQNKNSPGNRDDDEVTISEKKLWEYMKVFHKDFYSVYNKIIEDNTASKSKIDKIFIDHGFFIDKGPVGNGIRDNNEPYWDKNNNNVYDLGEYFVDYGIQGAPYIGNRMVWQEGEIIGTASNPGRQWRTNTVELKGNRIKVDNDVLQYKVIIKYKDYPQRNVDIIVDNMEGYISIPVPPKDYDSDIIIEPLGVEFSKPLKFTSSEFEAKYPESEERGYYVNHDFGIKGNVLKQDLPDSYTLEDVMHYAEKPDATADSSGYIYVDSDEDIESALKQFGSTISVPVAGTFSIGWFKWIFLLVLIVLAIFFYQKLSKRKKNKKKSIKKN
jgi:hypothetical protein